MKIRFLGWLLLFFSTYACAGKNEIRALLSKQSVEKYGVDIQAEQLFCTSGITAWDFQAKIETSPLNPDITFGDLTKILGFRELLESEGMLDAQDRISAQSMDWIQEMISEYIDLKHINIVYGKFKVSISDIEDKIIYSIDLENLTLTQANKIQKQFGWIML